MDTSTGIDTRGLDPEWDVVVVGAGLAGLSSAATAAATGASVLVLDRSPGGRAASDRVGRFRFNRGAHALLRRGRGRDVLKRLGVPVRGSLPTTRGGVGTLDGRIGLLPTGPVSFLRTDLLGGRAKRTLSGAFTRIMGTRPSRLADRTAADWFDELGGDDPEARAVLGMLARLVTYCTDFDRISADLAASQIRAVLTGNVYYLHGGWASLSDGLVDAAEGRGATLDLTTRVRRVVPDGRRVMVETAERTVAARRVVLAAGTPEASGSLLPHHPAHWSGLGPPARVACLDLGLATIPEPAMLLGIDRPLYLIRHSPPSRDLAPEGAAMVAVMRYLAPDENLSPRTARDELEEHCRTAGIEPHEAEEARYLHAMVACGAVPVPEHGGMAGRPGVADTGYDGVLVAGDWVGPAGYLADASLVSGEAAGRVAAGSLGRSLPKRGHRPGRSPRSERRNGPKLRPLVPASDGPVGAADPGAPGSGAA